MIVALIKHFQSSEIFVKLTTIRKPIISVSQGLNQVNPVFLTYWASPKVML